MKEDERFTEVCEPLFNKVLTDLKQIKVAVCGTDSAEGVGVAVRKTGHQWPNSGKQGAR